MIGILSHPVQNAVKMQQPKKLNLHIKINLYNHNYLCHLQQYLTRAVTLDKLTNVRLISHFSILKIYHGDFVIG